MPVDSIQTLLPVKLSIGDNVGIIAPSSPFDKKKFYKGIAFLEGIGLSVVFSEKIFKADGYLAGSDIQRAELLNSMFADPAIKAIICARGGYGALRILNSIDYSIIASNPKIFIGCSDISLILNTLSNRCGLVTFHGPMIESLGNASKQTKKSLSKILMTDQILTVKPENKIVIQSGSTSGIVCGGNLTTLCHLVGTPFALDFKDKIFLMEDVGEAPYRIDRMLTHMKLSGAFNEINGILLGSFTDCGEPDQIYRIVEDIFSEYPVPILGGFAIGHGEPNLTIPIGALATLDADKALLSFSFNA